jgi:hypothetical protein
LRALVLGQIKRVFGAANGHAPGYSAPIIMSITFGTQHQRGFASDH